MGSINPVILLPHVLKSSALSIAKSFLTSLTTGTGQFCVCPGLIIAIEDESLKAFEQHLSDLLNEHSAGVMLTPSIYQSYQDTAKARATANNCQLVASGKSASETQQGLYTPSLIYKTLASTFIAEPSLQTEMFGHSALIVSCQSIDEIEQVISSLSGQLSAAIHGEEDELLANKTLLNNTKQKVGRLVINGFTTGVEVCEAMMHGGPFPASTDVRFTSVGTAAIARFLRPICFQNCPDSLLPAALKNDNPLGLNRSVNGEYTKQAL